ncbi:hypothetical protein B566_EDAN000738 [Ephemera danica]|nr:hypothetical protein B566_EDAN000738 [Ephemera danica]
MKHETDRHIIQARIDTTNDNQVRSRPYRTPKALELHLNTLIEQQHNANLIKPLISPYNSGIF